MIIFFKHKGENVQWNLESDKISASNKNVLFGVEHENIELRYSKQKLIVVTHSKDQESIIELENPKLFLSGSKVWIKSNIRDQYVLNEFIEQDNEFDQIRVEGDVNGNFNLIPFDNTLVYYQNHQIFDYYSNESIYTLPFYIKGNIIAISTEKSLLAIGTNKGELLLLQKKESAFVLRSYYEIGTPIEYLFISNKIIITGDHTFIYVWRVKENTYSIHPNYIIDLKEIEVEEKLIDCYVSDNYLLIWTGISTYFINLNIYSLKKTLESMGLYEETILNQNTPYTNVSLKFNELKNIINIENSLIRDILEVYRNTGVNVNVENIYTYKIEDIADSIRNKEFSIIVFGSIDVEINGLPNKNFKDDYFKSLIKNHNVLKNFVFKKIKINNESSVLFWHKYYTNVFLYIDANTQSFPETINIGFAYTSDMFSEIFNKLKSIDQNVIINLEQVLSLLELKDLLFTKIYENYIKSLKNISSKELKIKVVSELIDPIRNSIRNFKNLG